MTNARRLLGVGAFLGLVGVVSLTHGEPVRPGAGPQVSPVRSYLSTPAQERDLDKSMDQSRFSKGGVFTYRPGKDEQLFAVALKPTLPASTVKGRDYLVMVSLSATQSGEGWQASTRIAESLVEMAGENDRVSLWTVGTPSVTKSLVGQSGDFLYPKKADDLKKLQAALEKLKGNYPAGDTDLKGGVAKAAQTFEGGETRQRVLVFLGDGQSTHNPLDADDRFALCQELVGRKVGFFPVPLGEQVHPENLHGLATGTGGVVLRTRVGEELLVDCMKRYFEAFNGSILYGVDVQLPATVKLSYPNKLPPLRGDAPALIVGSMKVADVGAFPIKVSGTVVGANAPIAIDVAEKIVPPELDNFFLSSLVEQWKSAKDRPAMLRGDRTLALAYGQTKLNRDELLLTAQLAIKDLKLEEAARAFEQVKIMAPHDTEPDAGLRVVQRIKAGKLSPDAMKQIMEKRTGAELKKGQWHQGAIVQLDLKDDKPNVGNVPAPGGQDRDDLLQGHRDLRIVQEQKWTEIVENVLRQGRRELQQDPDGTLDALRNILSRVQDNPDLSDRVRTGLSTRLSTALREAKSQVTILRVRKDEIARNVQVAKTLLERDQQMRTLQDRQEEQLRNFRTQIEIAYFDLKTKTEVMQNLLALQTENRLRGQPWPVAAQAMYEMTSAGFYLEQNRALRRQSEDRYLQTMLALDRSFIPFPDEPGIEFPRLATWKAITKYRKEKYEASNLPDDPAGRAAANSTMKLLEDEIEIPEEFKQPVPFKLVLKLFGDKLAARGKDLPVWIDQNAFKEDAAEAPELLESNVTFPPFLKRMQIATALRVALSQMPTNNATYMIRRDYIEITTIDRAIMEKVIRVHPVADLTIPISQTGGTQQFGQSQTIGGGIGGLNGGGFGGIGGLNGGGFGGIGGIGGIGGLGGIGGIGGFGGGVQPGNQFGGTTGSFNGGQFTGGFNGSLGALGGTAGMQELIKLITIVVDPGHWYYVQQQSFLQQGFNNANRPALNAGGALGAGALGGGALGGALGGAGGGAPAAGGPPTPPGEGGPADLLDPKTNTIYPYMPTLALIVRAQSRTHNSITGGITGGRRGAAPAMIMKNNEDRGLVPFNPNDVNKVQVAGAGGANDVKNKNNPLTALIANDPANKGKNGKALNIQIDPKVWDSVLAEGNIPASMIIATAETLFDQPDKKHVAEFLKSNLRRGIVVRPWVFEALAIALEATGGDADEIRRARLSAVALDPKDAEGFLEAARTMAENGQHDRALAFCRQAALIEPNLVHSYDQALVYAEELKDAKAMEWAANRLVSQDWPLDNNMLHLKAQSRVTSLAQSLDRSARKTDGDKLRAALQTLKERDLVVHLTWETSQEAADLELSVKEPTGTTCSFDQKQTTGGGVLLANDAKTPNKVTYVAAQAFPGEYEINVRKLWGRPLFGQARLEIVQYYGTPKETRRLEIIKLDQPGSVRVILAEGRRDTLAAVSPANLKKQNQKAEVAVNGFEQLRRLSYPEVTGGGARTGGASLPAGARTTESLPNQRTGITPNVGAGVNVEVRVSNDRKDTNLVMHPVYQTLKNARPANLSMVPGGK